MDKFTIWFYGSCMLCRREIMLILRVLPKPQQLAYSLELA